MRKFILFLIFCFFLAACRQNPELSTHPAEHGRAETPKAAETPGAVKEDAGYRLDYRSEPPTLLAGETGKLIFTFRELNGGVFGNLENVHEKPLHLIVVSEDLNEFSHLHPEPQADGSLAANHVFSNGGKYRLYVSFKPQGGSPGVRDFGIVVSGNVTGAQPLAANNTREINLEGVRVVMKNGEKFESNKETTLNFAVYDTVSGEPASNIEKYLGESAHFVIISEDLKNFVHAIAAPTASLPPEDAPPPNVPPNSVFGVRVVFPTDGLYKIFVEFKKDGKVFAAPFVLSVVKGNSDKIMETARIPAGAYKITVSRDGFVPNQVSLNKDIFQKLAFLRVDKENCADEIVFPELNVTKKLPVGEVVIVDLPKDRTGEINFTCGMKMYQGKIVIQ